VHQLQILALLLSQQQLQKAMHLVLQRLHSRQTEHVSHATVVSPGHCSSEPKLSHSIVGAATHISRWLCTAALALSNFGVLITTMQESALMH